MASDVAISVDRPDASVSVTQQQDGSVVVDLQTRRPVLDRPASTSFDDNLAERLSEESLSTIATELVEGYEVDERSRAEWLSNYNRGLQLLGLRLEEATTGASTDKTVSKVRHPQLLRAIIKAQALQQAEMLPANGPAKFRKDNDAIPDEIVEALESDFNHFLTVTAAEYYPDTDRALFYMDYGGTIFKKVYRDPLLDRPCSRFVMLPDLIVSQDATDLQSAQRVTHRIEMLPQDVKRYQRLKHWRDVDLPAPTQRVTTTDQDEARYVTGISPNRELQRDWPHIMLEMYTRLDLTDHGVAEKGQKSGIELPYRVSLDYDSKEIMEVRRCWKQADPLRAARRRFVKWGLIPGLGFLDLGYLHLLGNDTKALTAIERILIDAGMFSNFPSGVRAKGLRSEQNSIMPGPGEFPEIETGGLPIQQAIMALPFKGPSAELMALLQHLEENGDKTVGMVEIPTSEGTTNVPVGTIMAMIEQSTQTQTAIHRRLHQGQAEELQLLRELLAEEPEKLWIDGQKPVWTKEQLASAGLVPASDPNIPAHVHRIMQAVVLENLGQAHPEIYDQRKIQKRILSIARISDPEDLFNDPMQGGGPQTPPDPSLAIAQLTANIEKMHIAAKAESDKLNAMLKTRDQDLAARKQQSVEAKDSATLQKTDTGMALDRQAHLEDLADRAADRVSREKIGMKELATSVDQAAADHEATMDLTAIEAITGAQQQAADHSHDQQSQQADQAHAQATQAADQQHATQTQQTDLAGAQAAQTADQQHAVTTQASDQVAQAKLAKVKAKKPPAKSKL